MPSSPLSTLVPLRRLTRGRLEALKRDATFDAALSALLDAAPPSLVIPREPIAKGAPPRLERSDEQTPEKQLLLRDLARTAWELRIQRGEIQETGSRAIDWRPVPREPPAVIATEWPERRGFSP